MTNRLPYYLLALIIALGGLYGAHRGIVHYEVAKAVKIVNTSKDNEYKSKLLLAASDARKETTKLELSALALEKAKDEKIKAIDSKLTDALERLSKRPSRPTTDSPQTTTDIKACGGGELYREDGEFLTREAARAEALILERDYYYERYEDARKTLDEYSNSH